MSERKITLLLIGKTGSGKSATGNSILFKQNEPFETGDGGHSITKEISVKDGDIDDVHVTVIDSAGVLDTDMNVDMDKQVACENMTKAFLRCPKNSKIVLALVYKYPERFTEENKTAIYTLKAIFGEDFIKKYCIIIITYGDNFNNKYKGTKKLEEWCKEQRSAFGELLNEAEHRCIMFDNCTEDEQVKIAQVQELKRCVEQINSSYSHEIFEQAKRNHPRLYLEAKLPLLRKKYGDLMLNLQSKIHTIDRYTENAEEQLIAIKDEVLKLTSKITKKEEKANYPENDYSPFTNEKEEIDCLCRLLEDNITHSKMFKISNECKDKINTLFEETTRFDMKKSDEKELEKIQAKLQNTILSFKESTENIGSTIDVSRYSQEVFSAETQLEKRINGLKLQFKLFKVKSGLTARIKQITQDLNTFSVKETNSTEIKVVCQKVKEILKELNDEKERPDVTDEVTTLDQIEVQTIFDAFRADLDQLIEHATLLQALAIEKTSQINKNWVSEIFGIGVEVLSIGLGIGAIACVSAIPVATGVARTILPAVGRSLGYAAPNLRHIGNKAAELIRNNPGSLSRKNIKT